MSLQISDVDTNISWILHIPNTYEIMKYCGGYC